MVSSGEGISTSNRPVSLHKLSIYQQTSTELLELLSFADDVIMITGATESLEDTDHDDTMLVMWRLADMVTGQAGSLVNL